MRIDRLHAIAIAAALGLAACGGGEQAASADPTPAVALGNDVEVLLETSAPFAHAADFTERVQSTIDVALEYWGGSWSQVAGRSITLVDDQYVSCGGGPSLGCYDGNIRLTTRDPGRGTLACIEETVLVHEIGHAIIGDPNHTDPRWMEMDSVASALAGRPGYSADGDAPCTTYVSVWRHPLGSP
jgi:hypothetical protein